MIEFCIALNFIIFAFFVGWMFKDFGDLLKCPDDNFYLKNLIKNNIILGLIGVVSTVIVMGVLIWLDYQMR